MIHKSRPIFSTQFHPEAKGGPQDSAYLFDSYLESVRRYRQSQSDFRPERDTKPSPLLVDLLSKERVGVAPDAPARRSARQAQNVPTAAAAAAA